MAELDIVSPRIQATSLSATLQPSFQAQGPAFGIILEEGGEGDEIRAILWDNTNVNDVVGDDVASLNLDVITDADQATVEKFTGVVVLRIGPDGPTMLNSAVLDPAGATSREFTGVVVSVYRRTPLEAVEPESGEEFLLMRTIATGMYLEDLASNFAVLKNR